MDISFLVEYGVVLVVLVVLEGLLAADNAMVMAVMVRELPHEKQKKALFYGLLGAFILRFGALFAISLLANIWQVQAVGAAYLVFLALHFLVRKYVVKKAEVHEKEQKASPNFWWTVVKVELSDLAFAIDSILAGVAFAITLTPTGWATIGGMDIGQFVVVFLGGFIGVVIMRFAANGFIKLLAARPGLETGAFLIVGWVGVKSLFYQLFLKPSFVYHIVQSLLYEPDVEIPDWLFFFPFYSTPSIENSNLLPNIYHKISFQTSLL